MYVIARNAAHTNIEKARYNQQQRQQQQQQQQDEDNDEQEDEEPVEIVEEEVVDPEKYFPGQLSRRNPHSWTMCMPRQRISCEFSALVALALVAPLLTPSPPHQARPSTATGATGS